MISYFTIFCLGGLIIGGIIWLMAKKTIKEITKDRNRLSEDYKKLIDQNLKDDLEKIEEEKWT